MDDDDWMPSSLILGVGACYDLRPREVEPRFHSLRSVSPAAALAMSHRRMPTQQPSQPFGFRRR